ncbi:MAG: hypothetical protein LUQ22_01740 [Methanotrichaceae archaeon]|nr:hypothetical protein [Methanotrichaceae archaeon]
MGKRPWESRSNIRYLCLCMIAIMAIMPIFGLAQTMEPSRGSDSDKRINPIFSDGFMAPRGPPGPMGVPVELVVGGRGLALLGNETHEIRMHIERLVPLEPMQMRGLLASDKDIEEIKEAIMCEEGHALHRGIMKLDNLVYPLTNIKIEPAGYDTAIIAGADIALPSAVNGNQTAIVGQIHVEVSTSRGESIGEGQLSMKSGGHTDLYEIVLDMADHANALPGREKHDRFKK